MILDRKVYKEYNLNKVSFFFISGQYLTMLLQYLANPNNTIQTLYWFVSLGINNSSSTISNMIPVSLFHQNTVLTVSCLSDIITAFTIP